MPSAVDLIKQLVHGQEALIRTALGLFPLLDKVSDEPAAELADVAYAGAWRLRSLLDSS